MVEVDHKPVNDEQQVKALEEAVNLAEKKFDEYQTTILILEKKAILLITACIALIGYLLSVEIEVPDRFKYICDLFQFWTDNPSEIIRVLSLIILSGASVCCGFVIDISNVKIKGLSTHVSEYILDNYESRALVQLYEHVRTEYGNRTTELKDKCAEKAGTLTIAKLLFIAGLVGAVIWKILNFY